MQIRELFTDDDAVSPVIGVILMVAITVILAAVIGAFVLNFGGGGPSAPSVTWESSNTTTAVTFEHTGGDTIEDADDVLSITNGSATGGSTSATDMGTGSVFDWTSITVPEDEDYNLVWEPEDGDSSQQLSTHST